MPHFDERQLMTLCSQPGNNSPADWTAQLQADAEEGAGGLGRVETQDTRPIVDQRTAKKTNSSRGNSAVFAFGKNRVDPVATVL